MGAAVTLGAMDTLVPFRKGPFGGRTSPLRGEGGKVWKSAQSGHRSRAHASRYLGRSINKIGHRCRRSRPVTNSTAWLALLSSPRSGIARKSLLPA